MFNVRINLKKEITINNKIRNTDTKKSRFIAHLN